MFVQFPSEVPNESVLTTSRRGALGLMGMAGLAVAAGTGSLEAASVGSGSGRRVDLTSLSPDWVRQQGRAPLLAYTRYVMGLNLKFITPEQVILAHAKSHGSIWNTLPPRSWWTRMGYTLRVVDRIAGQLGIPVKEIVSAYRSPAYNAHCPGAKSGSWHQANMAVDVVFPVSASSVTAMSRNLRDRGLFKGGVGGYSTFTHIDTRGENMNW